MTTTHVFRKVIHGLTTGLGLFMLTPLHAQTSILISGRTLDSLLRPVNYVNIGIAGKNTGTVSDDGGNFTIAIEEEFLVDSLTFSRIGYHSEKLGIRSLQQKGEVTIVLHEKSSKIPELEFISKKLKLKRKGNVSRKEAIVMAMSSDTNNLGYEIGTVIHLPKNPVLIKDFNFHITGNRPDSVKLRFNLYRYVKKEIGENLLNENIYFLVRKEDIGDFTLDLSSYHLHASDDVFISLENVAVYVSEGPDPEVKIDEYSFDRIVISGSVIQGTKSFTRKVSQGSWEPTWGSFSPGFWLHFLK